jgi:hypothetical protein
MSLSGLTYAQNREPPDLMRVFGHDAGPGRNLLRNSLFRIAISSLRQN